MLAVVLVCLPAIAAADEDAGWSNDHYIPPEKWKESTVEIPRWPEQDDLLEVSAGRSGFPFRVYTDPESLTIGDDGVVRYVLVIVSSSGAWNTSFEGILCDKGEYRRYAYGSGQQWHQLAGSTWQRIIKDGKDGYRYALYQDYLCNAEGHNPDVSDILRRIRYDRGSILDD
jgi:hypothetical protein